MDKRKRNIIIAIIVILVLILCCYYIKASKTDDPKITETDAQKIALEDASVTENELASVTISYESKDNDYTIIFSTKDGTKQYDYTINGDSGQVEKKEIDLITTPDISIEKAKAIALEDAGFDSSDVKFVKLHIDSEETEYDIEFTAKDDSNSKTYKYEYTINAKDGTIIDHEKEVDA